MPSDFGAIHLAALLAGLRRIFVRNFAVTCSIGIHAFERAAPQRVLINIDLWVRSAAATDEIEAVVDYDFLREEVRRLAASRHFNLQETLVAAIADACLARPGVLAARVSTEKPDVYPDCEAVGLEAFAATDAFRAALRAGGSGHGPG